jgi:hypothetical protein
MHLKAPDSRKTADWYVKAFNFKILSDGVRVFGDRFGAPRLQAWYLSRDSTGSAVHVLPDRVPDLSA